MVPAPRTGQLAALLEEYSDFPSDNSDDEDDGDDEDETSTLRYEGGSNSSCNSDATLQRETSTDDSDATLPRETSTDEATLPHPAASSAMASLAPRVQQTLRYFGVYEDPTYWAVVRQGSTRVRLATTAERIRQATLCRFTQEQHPVMATLNWNSTRCRDWMKRGAEEYAANPNLARAMYQRFRVLTNALTMAVETEAEAPVPTPRVLESASPSEAENKSASPSETRTKSASPESASPSDATKARTSEATKGRTTLHGKEFHHNTQSAMHERVLVEHESPPLYDPETAVQVQLSCGQKVTIVRNKPVQGRGTTQWKEWEEVMQVLRSDGCTAMVQEMWSELVLERPVTQAANGEAQDAVTVDSDPDSDALRLHVELLGDGGFTTRWHGQGGSTDEEAGSRFVEAGSMYEEAGSR